VIDKPVVEKKKSPVMVYETTKKQKTINKSKKMSNTDPIKIPELNPFVRTFNKLTVQNFHFVEVFCKLQTMYVPMLHASLDYPFLIAPSILSNVY
jgi:hypothetical protein